MTDDNAQTAPTPAESTPVSEVATPTPTEPAAPSSEATPVIEQVASTDEPSVIPKETQSAQEIPEDSRPVSQSTSTAPVLKSLGRKWSANDRAKSAATHARKKDAHLVKLVEYAKAHSGKITNNEIEKLLHVSDATASRYAKILVERGVLRKEGKGRGAQYAIL